MRFDKYDLGTTRIKTWFALFPVTIKYGSETRWLEKVTVKQKWVRNKYAILSSEYYWENIEFING